MADKPRLGEAPLSIIPIELLGLENDEETGVYDNIEIEDMDFDEDLAVSMKRSFSCWLN